MNRFLAGLIPFIFIGIAIVALVFSAMILAYLFFFGAIIGLILFTVSWIRQKFFAPKIIVKSHKTKSGRVIDTDHWRKL